MKALLARLLLGGAVLYAIVLPGPGLIRDTAQLGQWVPATDWAATEAKCRRLAFLVSFCSVVAERHADPENGGQNLEYSSFASWGGESVAFVRSAGDPDVITLRQAADGLFGRWAVMALWLFALFRVVVPARPRGSRTDAPAAPDPSAEAMPGAGAPGRTGQGGPGPRKTFGLRPAPPARGR